MTDTAADTAPAEAGEDTDIVSVLAKAIWRTRSERGMSTDDRKASWRDNSAVFRQEARKLMRQIEASGLTLSRDPNATQVDDD